MPAAILDALASVVYPQSCHVCGISVDKLSDGIACTGCWTRTRLFSDLSPVCPKCGTCCGRSDLSSGHCVECRDLSFDAAAAAGVYEHALSATVRNLKRFPHLPARLKRSICDTSEHFRSATVVIPVPLARQRLIERGFNQAHVIAQVVGGHLGLPIDDGSLKRSRHTAIHRVSMDATARRQSVRNAFSVSRHKLIENQRVLLVDDVMTSGSTGSACADVLKANGAAWVGVLTLARAIRYNGPA